MRRGTPLLLFLLAATPPAVRALDCADCGGNIFKNNIEIWNGYLLQVAGQLGINVQNPCRTGLDMYRTVVEAGGGMCVKFPGEISIPAPAYACYDASTVKPPTNTTSTCTHYAEATERR